MRPGARTFRVDRTVVTRGRLFLQIGADCGADAGRAADELKFAIEREDGLHQQRPPAEPWAALAAKDLTEAGVGS